MSTISSVNNSNAYNPQVTTKVATANSTNLANNAANESAFSSYIGQAFAQIGLANPPAWQLLLSVVQVKLIRQKNL